METKRKHSAAHVLLWTYRAVNKALLSLFFDRQFLRGKHFDGGLKGYQWAWRAVLWQRIFGFNREAGFPVSSAIRIIKPENIVFHPDDINNFHGIGNYYQANAKITIGRGSYIAPNVGLITENHDPADPEKRLPGKEIVLGEKCWIGMNAVVLPGVVLGPRTVVGAGAVVTKSFPEGWCVLGGVPAVKIKDLSENRPQDGGGCETP